MTRPEKVLVAFLCLLVATLVAENVYLVVQAELHSPAVIEACPAPKGGK